MYWLNYGCDAYSGVAASDGASFSRQRTVLETGVLGTLSPIDHPLGLKPKDLMMMPARVALALQADGWWVRSEIVWHKPNPMPESVTDRPTNAHEKVYLLTKSARYFYDAEAACGNSDKSDVRTTQRGERSHRQRVLTQDFSNWDTMTPNTNPRGGDGSRRQPSATSGRFPRKAYQPPILLLFQRP